MPSPWVYFAATFAWTWLIWGAGILFGVTAETGQGLIVALLRVIGPMVTRIGFTYLTRDKEGRRDYWKRVIDLNDKGSWSRKDPGKNIHGRLLPISRDRSTPHRRGLLYRQYNCHTYNRQCFPNPGNYCLAS